MHYTIVFSEPSQIDGYEFPPEAILLDENSYKTKKKARTAKGLVAATMTPFVIVYDDNDNISKVFYREEYKDPIYEWNKWLNNENISKETQG